MSDPIYGRRCTFIDDKGGKCVDTENLHDPDGHMMVKDSEVYFIKKAKTIQSTLVF